jgi:hypothetical protein
MYVLPQILIKTVQEPRDEAVQTLLLNIPQLDMSAVAKLLVHESNGEISKRKAQAMLTLEHQVRSSQLIADGTNCWLEVCWWTSGILGSRLQESKGRPPIGKL